MDDQGPRVKVVGGEARYPDAVDAAVHLAASQGLAADAVWRVAAGEYPAPSCLAELVRALGEDAHAGGVAARVIPVDRGELTTALLRPSVADASSQAPGAVTFSDRWGWDAQGHPTPLPDPAPAGPPGGRAFATVVMRTRGDRPRNLEEALTCLAAQRDASFDVVLVANGGDPDPVQALVSSFEPSFAERVRILGMPAAGRSAPLNAGLDAATGEYLAFLDDDDLVSGDWIEAFHATASRHPGRVVRGGAVVQPVRRRTDGRYATVGPPRLQFGGPGWDLVDHLVDNRSPIFSWAVPLDAVRDAGIRFDESLPTLEDWDFLMRCALALGVAETGRVTGVYHWWETGESALDKHGPEEWAATRSLIHDRLDALVGGSGLVARLATLEAGGAGASQEALAVRARLERATRPRRGIVDRVVRALGLRPDAPTG